MSIGVFRDDSGLTSLAVVLAAVVSLLLVLTGCRVLWVSGTSAEVQYVADAAALAGENVVASYLTVARVVDAVALSLGLIMVFLYLVATVVACIPYVNSLAEPLFQAARRVSDARVRFARSAERGLEGLETALPVLIQSEAQSVVAANSRTSGASYVGVVVPFPLSGEGAHIEEAPVDSDGFEETARRAAEVTDANTEAHERMRSSLEAAFRADSMDGPSCLASRAARLAGMSGADNPRFTTSSGWSFAVPLARARTYYARRLASEKVAAGAPLEERIRSVARVAFYRTASSVLETAHAPRTGDLSAGLSIPELPHDVATMKRTRAYTERVYPIHAGTLHVFSDCPGAVGAPSGMGSCSDVDTGRSARCATCDWGIERIGSVPSASTNTTSGFEHYWRTIAREARSYREAAEKVAGTAGRARQLAEGATDGFSAAFDALGAKRFDPHPPGMHGCVAVVCDPSGRPVPDGPGGPSTLPPRIAVSAAAPASQTPEYGDTVISEAMSALVERASGPRPSAGLGWLMEGLADVWGDSLLVYLRGTEALSGAIDGMVAAVPGMQEAGVSEWATGFVDDVLEACGLQPAAVDVVRPLTVNSNHVLATDPAIGSAISGLQRNWSALSGGAPSAGTEMQHALSVFAHALEQAGVDALEAEYVVASVDVAGILEVPVTVSLPEAVVRRGKDALDDARGGFEGLFAGMSGASGEWWR